MTTHRFTPTQDLIIDVLLARHRLGEGFWTFDSRNRQSLKALCDMNLVFLMDGNVENTVRAGLTEEGKKEFYGPYQSPLEKKLKFQEDMVVHLAKQNEHLRQEALADYLEAQRSQS
jgi:hypothetical protein